MRGLLDSLFEEVEADLPKSRQTSHASSARGSNEAMPNKKSEAPMQSSSSSSSATSRSVLLPVESAPVSVNSSRSQTMEYVDEEDLPVIFQVVLQTELSDMLVLEAQEGADP